MYITVTSPYLEGRGITYINTCTPHYLVGVYAYISNGAINIEINISTSCYSINLLVSVYTYMKSREVNKV